MVRASVLVAVVYACLVTTLLVASPIAMGTESASELWSFEIPSSQVPLGQLLEMSVTGPGNGIFTVNLTAPPFDHSYAVFYYVFELPSSSNGSLQTLNLSIPTDELDLGAYQVQIVNGTTVIGSQIVKTTLPGNITQVQYNESQDQAKIVGLQTSVAHYSGEVSYLETVLWTLVIVSLSGSAASFSLVALRDRMARDEDFLRTARNAWRRALHAKAYSEHDDLGTLQKEEEDDPLPNPERYYKSGYCTDCRAQGGVWWAKNEIIDHVAENHWDRLDPSQEGVPIEGRDFYIDQKRLNFIRQAYKAPKTSKKLLKQRDKSLRIDTDQLLGKGN